MKSVKVSFDSKRLNTAIGIAKALAHPLRLQILEYIDSQGVVNVNKIYGSLGIEQSITSQHLRVMKDAGVVDAKRDGKFVHYFINYELLERTEYAMHRFYKRDIQES